MAAKLVHKPVSTIFQGGEIGRLQGMQEGTCVLPRPVLDAARGDLPPYKIPCHHEQQRLLDELPTHQKFGRMKRSWRMKALRPTDVARVNKQIVKGNQALQVEGTRMGSGEYRHSPDACFQWSVEGCRCSAHR